jgi:hypothetical protein
MGPHPALRATFSPREKDTTAHFFLSWTPLPREEGNVASS